MATPASEPRVLERDPSSLPLMLKAALPAVPAEAALASSRPHDAP